MIHKVWTYDEPDGEHDPAMSEGRLTLGDGRTLAWREYGPPDGRPLLRFQGMPGSRHSRHPHEESYDRFGVRVIVSDRPGIGTSTRLRGRGISVIADDAVSLLDHLGLDVAYVSGTSGGGPHALAFARCVPSACGRRRGHRDVAGHLLGVADDRQTVRRPAGELSVNR
jgi:alpha/beta hydrolase fold